MSARVMRAENVLEPSAGGAVADAKALGRGVIVKESVGKRTAHEPWCCIPHHRQLTEAGLIERRSASVTRVHAAWSSDRPIA
jgi:hypothetical protein